MKNEFELLGLLERYDKTDDGVCINDLAAIYKIDVARSLVSQLLEMGYLAETKIQWAYCRTPDIDRDAVKYRLSEEGRDYLRAKKKVREQEANNDCKLNNNNVNSWKNRIKTAFITAIVSSAVAYIFANVPAIIAFIKRLFVR